MKYELGYGKTTQKVEIPQNCAVDLILPNRSTTAISPSEEIERALDNPIGTAKLEEIARGKHRVVIITSDITRPCPTYLLLPPLLNRLDTAGVKRSEITIVLALGSHRSHTESELEKLLGKRIADEYCCVDSNAGGYVHMGTSSRGTPIDIAEPVATADMRICVGNIELHYFAGYSGGAKAIMPGVSTKEAIAKNHSLMLSPNAAAGILDGNPIREDIEEAGRVCSIDFILNCVLDEHKQLVKAVAGNAVAAHREGCVFLDAMYKIKIARRYDIILCSQGGAPKDINLYQTQKALDNAKNAVRDGGTIILVGECSEGFGNTVFEQWITGAEKPEEITERIQKDFVLGGHKAAAVAQVLLRARVSLVSSLPESPVKKMFMIPYDSAQKALDDALDYYGKNAHIAIIPFAGSTLPFPDN